MEKKELEEIVDAVWRRIEERVAPSAVRRARLVDRIPDAEDRLALWMQMTRSVRLAKNVDLGDFALRYPVTEREIMAAVKTISRPGATRRSAKRPEYSARQLTDSLINILGYSVLASRDALGDDKPADCPSENKFEKPGSFCHEDDSNKGDFTCRGDEKKGRDFVCTPAESGFFCQHPGRSNKFVCDANDSGDKFDCGEGRFLCDDQGAPFYCQRKEKAGFSCAADKEDKDKFFCRPKGQAEFECSAKQGFSDKCFNYECFSPPRGTYECPQKEKGATFDAGKCLKDKKYECLVPPKGKYECVKKEQGGGFDPDKCSEDKYECLVPPKGKYECAQKEKGSGFVR